jgi:hypothetical protein
MPEIKLWTLSVLLGLLISVPNVYGLLQPTRFAAAVRKFPRNTPAGYLLMILATLWFLAYVKQESISDFANFKPALFILFAGVGIGACLFVHDFLAVRGLAVVFLLLAKMIVDTARWVDTNWRLVVVTWAYVMVMAGMWWTVSPWRLRDILNWSTASDHRTRLTSGIRLGFGVLLIVLGVAVYRPAEQKSTGPSNSAAIRFGATVCLQSDSPCDFLHGESLPANQYAVTMADRSGSDAVRLG